MNIYYILKVVVNDAKGKIENIESFGAGDKESTTRKLFEEIRQKKHKFFKHLLDTSDEYLNNDDYCFMVDLENHICTSEGDKTLHYYFKSVNLKKL